MYWFGVLKSSHRGRGKYIFVYGCLCRNAAEVQRISVGPTAYHNPCFARSHSFVCVIGAAPKVTTIDYPHCPFGHVGFMVGFGLTPKVFRLSLFWYEGTCRTSTEGVAALFNSAWAALFSKGPLLFSLVVGRLRNVYTALQS